MSCHLVGSTDAVVGVIEMQSWLTRTKEKLTVEVPASAVVELHQPLPHRQVSCLTWDFSDDLSQSAGICINS